MTGFERASCLAEFAGQSSGCPVIVGDFVDYDFSLLKVDALTLIGALIHIRHQDLAGIFVKYL